METKLTHSCRLWLNTEGNRATGNALEKALKQCDREDIVDKCMFNVKMVTDNDEAVMAQVELRVNNGAAKAFTEDNNVTTKSLSRDYSIDVNVDDSDYRENITFNESERLGDIREENDGGIRGVRDYLRDEEYEREEQKYVAEEKEIASSAYHEETMKIDNNIVTQRTENNDYLHEEMKKMSVEESRTLSYGDGEVKKTESRLEEAYENKEQYNSATSQTKQMQMTDNIIMTDTRTETKEEYAAESHETKHYEEAEVVRGKTTLLRHISQPNTNNLETALSLCLVLSIILVPYALVVVSTIF